MSEKKCTCVCTCGAQSTVVSTAISTAISATTISPIIATTISSVPATSSSSSNDNSSSSVNTTSVSVSSITTMTGPVNFKDLGGKLIKEFAEFITQTQDARSRLPVLMGGLKPLDVNLHRKSILFGEDLANIKSTLSEMGNAIRRIEKFVNRAPTEEKYTTKPTSIYTTYAHDENDGTLYAKRENFRDFDEVTMLISASFARLGGKYFAEFKSVRCWLDLFAHLQHTLEYGDKKSKTLDMLCKLLLSILSYLYLYVREAISIASELAPLET